MRGVTLLAAVFAVALAPAASAGAKHQRVRVKERIVYGQGRVTEPARGRVNLRLDLYRPPARFGRPRPAVVLIHGGGFVTGARDDPPLMSGETAFDRLLRFARRRLS